MRSIDINGQCRRLRHGMFKGHFWASDKERYGALQEKCAVGLTIFVWLAIMSF